MMYKYQYNFITKDLWYIYSEEKHRWLRAREALKLRTILSTSLCQKFMERATYWNQEKTKKLDDDIWVENCEKKRAISLDIITKLKSAGYKDSIMKECKAHFCDEKFEETLDSRPHLIGFNNGVYDLCLHEFREGNPDDYISFSTGRNYIPYNPDSENVIEINTFLSQVFTIPDIKRYIVDIFSSMLDGGILQEKFYIFTGNGSNSKSKLLELIQKAVGDYYCILPISLLTQKRAASNSAQSELERTKGRRYAVMQEPSEGEKINIGLMKELSGDDGGTWRRIRVINFDSKFTDEPNPNNPKEFALDTELGNNFDRWADAFISMLIENHKNHDIKTIKEPMEVRIATESYKKNNDIIGQYISDRIVKDEDTTETIMLQAAYTDFKIWVSRNIPKGKRIPDRMQMRSYMENMFGPYPTNKGWKGIRYVVDYENESEQ